MAATAFSVAHEEALLMDVLVTGGDTDLGRVIAEGFRDAGHNVVIAGARRDELDVAAKELDVESIVLDNTDGAALEQMRDKLPQHLDTIINVPAPAWSAGDPRTYTLAERATVWRNTLDSSLLSAVLTVQILGDQMRSGGAIVTVVPECPKDGTADAAIKAAVSNWTAGQAEHFGIRGITINVVAAGRGAETGYDGIDGSGATAGSELTKLALFLTTPAARHITGETLHVSAGALATFA